MRHLLNMTIATLALVLLLSVGATGAEAHRHARGVPHGAAAHKSAAATMRDRKRARRRGRHARRSVARRRRESRGKGERPTSPAPSPATSPEVEARSEPEPAPTPSPEPDPAPAPEQPSPGASPETQPAPSGGLLFNGNFDTGFKGWYVQSLGSRATLVSAGAFQGPQAARFEVRQGDVEPDTGSQRSEVSGPTFDEGEDLYIRDAIRVPSANTFSTSWQIVDQLHENEWSGSPGVALFLEDNHALRLGSGDSSLTFWRGPTLQSDRWYDLIYRVDLSQNSAVGFVEVWLDGVQQKLVNGETRVYGRTMQTPSVYLKAGIYRAKTSTGTSIVEHDAISVGTSYAAVSSG